MAEQAVRYFPRARFTQPARPVHEPFVFDLLSHEMEGQSHFAPGRRVNLQWIDLAEGAFSAFEGMPGEMKEFRPPALLLDYQIVFSHTYAGKDWFYVPSIDEEAHRALERADYEVQLEVLNAKENPSDKDKEKINALEKLLLDLSFGGAGYLETSYNWGGSGVTGIFYGLQVPNIPVTVKSAFVNLKNRALSFRWKCLEPPVGQVEYEHSISIGKGATLYELLIGEDGNSAQFIHYRNMSEKARTALLAELKEVLDRGRLTVADKAQILEWETAILRIQYLAKKRDGQEEKKLTQDEELSIASYQKKIDDLKDSKRGLTQADEEERRDLEEQLYLDDPMKFNLQEEARSLLGVPVDITFQFLRAGYVIITVNGEMKVYENKRLTGGVPEGAEPAWGDGLPDQAQITVKSSGGKWGLLYGHPLYATRGSLWSQPFEIPFAFSADEVRLSLEADANGRGASARASLVTLRPRQMRGKVPLPGRYQVRLDLRSDAGVSAKEQGSYTPEVYGLEVHIAAAPVTATGATVWDSQIHGANAAAHSGTWITDLLVQDERNSARLCALYVANSKGQANLPLLLGGKACDIWLHDRQTNQDVMIQKHGFTATGAHPNLDGLASVGRDLTTQIAIGNEVQIDIAGVSGFLNKEITQRFSYHDMYVGDAIIAFARDAGLPAFLYANVPAGATDTQGRAIPRVSRRAPGKTVSARPASGTTFWEAIQELVKDHAPRWQVWEDENGLRFTFRSLRLRSDLAYSDTAPVTSKLRLRRGATEAGGFMLVQDLREYYTSATFVGARNPLTGMRYSATESIPQATDPRFSDSMFYVGEGAAQHYTAHVDESLKSDAACRAAAREFLNITPLTPMGLPPWYGSIRVDFDHSVKADDLPTVFGVKFLVNEIQLGQLGEGSMQMDLGVRLAEDKKVAA